MRLIFAGTPEPAVVALQKLIASEHEIAAVITRPDARKGRGRSLHPSPVKEIATQHGIEVLTPASLKHDTEIRQRIGDLVPDAIAVVAYGNLIPKDMLDMAPHGWINLHFSLLPQWRGAAPVQAAIKNGDTETGATTFRIDEGLDTGDILGCIHDTIASDDTAEALLTRLSHAGADLLVETMTGLELGTISPVAQPEAGTHAHKLTTQDARVHWSEEAAHIDRAIRAHTPEPGAWTLFANDRYKLGPVTLTDSHELAPGQIHASKSEVRVGTATQDVQLGLIQPPGKKFINALDWARGLRNKDGMVFQ